MSQEKFIRGKKDSCRHVGRRSNRRREDAVVFEMKDFVNTVIKAAGPIWDQQTRELQSKGFFKR